MKPSFLATVVTPLVALALCVLSATAWAAGPGRHEGDPIAAMAGLRAQLNLNTSQQAQFDNALALSRSAHQGMRDGLAQLRTATQAEIAKSAPDLAVLATLSDQVQQQNSGLRHQARAAWLALYDTFSGDQKLVVRDAISARVTQAEAFRAQARASRGEAR